MLLREHTCQCSIESIKQLAKSHKLTQQILGKNLIWNQLIKSTFPKVNNIDPAQDFPLEDWPHDYADLASDKAKVRQLTGILILSEDSDRSQLRMDLVQRICKIVGLSPPDGSSDKRAREHSVC